MKRSFREIAGVFAVCVVAAANVAFGDEPIYYSTPILDANGPIVYAVANSGPAAPASTADSIVIDAPMSATMLSGVPTSTWTYGCTATSAGMIMGYYDRHGYANIYTGPTNGGIAPLANLGQGQTPSSPIAGAASLIATQNNFDGRTTRGHVDDYWISYQSGGPDPFQANGWTEHTWSSCTADFLGTNQWKWDFNLDGTRENNVDGSTVYFSYGSNTKLYDYIPSSSYGLPQTEACHGLRLFAESRGYSVVTNYTQKTDNLYAGGFSFANFQSEINAGRPVMIHVTNHTMVGVGYDASSNLIYIHDTWDNSVHSMTWGGSYSALTMQAVTVLQLAAVTAPWEFSSLTGGSWHSTGNWLNDSIPTSTSNVVFHLGRSSPYTLTATGAASAGSLAVQTDNLALAFASNSLAVSNAITLAAGAGENAQLALNSGSVSAASAFVGGSTSTAGGTGNLTIAGASAAVLGTFKVWNTTGTIVNLNSGNLTVGSLDTNSNPAHFNWTGGSLSVSGTSGLAISSSGPLGPHLSLDSGKALFVTNALTVGVDGALTFLGGTCTAGSIVNYGSINALTTTGLHGSLVNNTTVTGPAGGSVLTFYDRVSGAGSYTGNTCFAGEFSPGNSPAIVHLENVIFNSTSTLVVELGGTTPGTDYDQLVFNSAFLAGTLHIDLLNGFQPQGGDSFLVLSGLMTGGFDHVELPSLSGGLQWNTALLGSGVISVVPEPASFALLLAASSLLLRRSRRN